MAEHADATRKVTEDDHPTGHCDDPAATNDIGAHADTDGTDAESEAGADADGGGVPGGDPVTDKARTRLSPIRLGAIFGIATVVALTALAGWFGHRAYDAHRAQQQRELFLEVGRQGAVNLTTIDWQHADADAQRILNASTGRFYDDFAARSKASSTSSNRPSPRRWARSPRRVSSQSRQIKLSFWSRYRCRKRMPVQRNSSRTAGECG
jgi:Mce-associated membrane protein